MKKFITYFTLLCSVVLFGQTKPGGTTLNVELWLKADAIGHTPAVADSTLTGWNDLSPNASHFEQTGAVALRPKFNKATMNFNPAVTFDKVNAAQKLQSVNNFPYSATKSYYIFYVTDLNADKSATLASVLSFKYSGSNSTYLGWNSDDIRATVVGTAMTNTNTSGKTYGIGAFILPNQTGTAIPNPNLYHNGLKNTGNLTKNVINAAAGKNVLGNLGLGTTNANPFAGDIQEVVILSAAQGTLIPVAELKKVQSYLAVKYGLSLDSSANGQPDYVNTDGTDVWTGASNTNYQNNIFGIGRDDASGLYQKQSQSFDKSTMTVFVGSTVAETNQANTGTLADKTYLMLGANSDAAGSGFTSYVYASGAAFANGPLAGERVNNRSNRILKAQATANGVATSLTVNVQVGGRYLLVSSDPTFPPATTRAYLIDANKVANNVLINNGDYLSTAEFVQAPGGVVNGLRVWLRTDDCTSVDRIAGATHNVNRWLDRGPLGNNYTFDAVTGVSAKKRPTFIASDVTMNFKPAIQFEYDDYLATITGGPMSTASPKDFMSFLVYNSTTFANTAVGYTHGFGSTNPRTFNNAGSARPALGFSPSSGGGRMLLGGVGGYNSPGPGFVSGNTALHLIHTHKRGTTGDPGYVRYDFGGLTQSVAATNSWTAMKMNLGGVLGGANLATGTFQGLMSEIFFYERQLSTAEEKLIRSYLAMKYAITLANGYAGASQYTLSDGTTIVWDGAATPTNAFHHNVAGLVRDDNSFLFNNISRSTSAGNIITMEVQPVGDMCANNNSSVLANDKSGLFWGHDGKLNPDPRTITSTCAAFTKVTSRTWIVKKSNLTDLLVTLKASGGDYPFNGGGWESYMIVADSPADITAGNYKQVIPMTFVNNEHVVNYNFTDEYTYIAFGGKEATTTSACTTCTFQGEKVLNFNKTTWTAGQKIRMNDLGDGFTANIEVLDPDNSIRARYPRASSQKSQRSLKRGNPTTNPNAVTTKVTLSSAAKATFEIFDIDRTAYRYNQVEVYGLCNGQRLNPKTSYVAKAAANATSLDAKSSYTIAGPQAFAKVRNGASAYTAKKGKMLVEFEKPVTEIYIVSKINYGRPATGYQTDGVGPMKFTCPAPEPAVNEEGLSFSKQGPANVQQCEDIEYTFKIKNTNCEDKTVKFEDILPATDSGLKWIAESLSIDGDAVATATINAYEGTQNLSITDLLVKGASTLTFRASARYDVGSTTSGTVYNQAKIDYNEIVNNVSTPRSLLSSDAFVNTPYPQLDASGNPVLDTNGNPVISTDYRTKTKVTPVGNIPAKVTSSVTFDKSCVNKNQEVTVTLNVNNPNSFSLNDMVLNVLYSEDFTFVANSLSSATINLASPVITDLDAGLVSLENFILPAGNHAITFNLKAPAVFDLQYDEEGELMPVLEMTYDFNSESTDVCLAGAGESSGEASLKNCDYCIKPGDFSAAGSPTKVGITVQQKQAAWPENIPNGHITLESKTKGLVITRVAHVETQIMPYDPNANGGEYVDNNIHTGSIAEPKVGMVVYDIQDKCVKLFSHDMWQCIERVSCEVGAKPAKKSK